MDRTSTLPWLPIVRHVRLERFLIAEIVDAVTVVVFLIRQQLPTQLLLVMQAGARLIISISSFGWSR